MRDTIDTPAPLLRYTIEGGLTLAGQPEPEEWARLAAEGFATVVNIRSDPERAAVQRLAAEAAGLRYVYLPLPVYELEPEHLAAFHATMAQLEGPVLLHCRTATRVALLWLLAEVVYNGRDRAEAERALRAAGYGDSSMETFAFCADDYFERVGWYSTTHNG